MTRLRTLDVALPVVLGAAVFVYLRFFWPNSLFGNDEGEFVYGASRILDGQVLYRDFFELWGPMAPYGLALAYAAFGVSMETARGSMASVHAVITVLVYAVVRRLGVRPALAAVAALTHVALLYPALPFASPHWLSTALALAILLSVLRQPLTTGRVVGVGILTALLALTQQPRGVGVAATVVIVLMRDGWTRRRARAPQDGVLWLLGAYALTLVGVVIVALAGFVAAAGLEPVFDALIRFPLGPYRQFPFHREGHWFLLIAYAWVWRRMIFGVSPLLLVNLLPFIVPVGAARLLWQVRQGAPVGERRPLFVAVVFSAMSILSVLYQPNYSHFAVVGPIWLTLLAESLEHLVRYVENRSTNPLLAPLAALTVLLLVMLEVRRSSALAWSGARAVDDTPFGRVHFHSASEVEDVEAVRATLRAAGAKHIFVYPCAAALYLMTETSNPTRFDVLIPGYNTAAQFAEAEQTLERDRVPFVVRSFWFWGKPGDPLRSYLDAHYEPVKLARTYAGIASLSLLRRKPGDAGSPAARK